MFLLAVLLFFGCPGPGTVFLIDPPEFEVAGTWSGEWTSDEGPSGTWSVRFFCAGEFGCRLSWEGEIHGATCSAVGDFVAGAYVVEADLLSFNGEVGEGPQGPETPGSGFISLSGTLIGNELIGTYFFISDCQICSCDMSRGSWTLRRT